MKQTAAAFIVGFFASIPIFISGTEVKEYPIASQEIIKTVSTEELFKKTDLYKRTVLLEQKADSLHKEVEKLKDSLK